MEPLATNAAAGHPQTSPPTINDLPIEVFHVIVSLAVRKEHEDGHYYGRLRALRLVAAVWSTLIDDYPQCWNIISSSDPELVWRMALQKSKQAEIDVDCVSTSIPLLMRTNFPTTLTKAIVIHAPRVRKLKVIDQDFEYLISNASTAPYLRSLGLWDSQLDIDPIALPLHPVNWAPNLRDVTLDRSDVILKGLLWGNLEVLRIRMGGSLPMEDVITILAASPGFRCLDLSGSMQPRSYSHQRLIPTVKLEALESVMFRLNRRSTPFEALGSIIASPKEFFRLVFYASDENLRPENLRSIGRFASRIADGEAEITLKLVVGKRDNSIEMGEFHVEISNHEYEVLNPLAILTHMLEGLPPQSLLAVKTAEISRTEPSLVLGLLPIIHSFFPNTSHLIIAALDGDLASSIGGRNTNGWIFPQLESLSILHYRGGHHAPKAIEPRLKALESGEQLAMLKRLCLTSVSGWNVDEAEIAELNALVPEVIVSHPNG